MEWQEVVAAWDEAVAKAGKGQRASIHRIGDQKAVRCLAAEATDRLQVLARAEVMFSEEWREYFTIASLWNSWEALGEKGTELERQRKINSQAVGNPPTKIEEIRRIWSEPRLRAGDEAHQELTEWLRRQLRQG